MADRPRDPANLSGADATPRRVGVPTDAGDSGWVWPSAATTIRRQHRLDVLLISEPPLWPPLQGFCVHGTQMARALATLGLRVGLSAMANPPAEAPPPPDWLDRLAMPWPQPSPEDVQRSRRALACPGDADPSGSWASRLRGRIVRHEGVDPDAVAGVLTLIRRHRPRVVIALAQHGPMLLRPVVREHPDIGCWWYGGDDPVRYQLSRWRHGAWWRPSQAASCGRMASVYGLMQRLFTRELDGVIGVSLTETRWLRASSGLPGNRSVCIPNGVDTRYFTPGPAAVELADTPDALHPATLAFWGRMDFEPNVDAVCWFADSVWPQLFERRPDARWWIVGACPSSRVLALADRPGIDVVGEVADIRPWARRASVTVLPMRLGGGIKNKLLEAAAMARPIVATPHALRGLSLPDPAGTMPLWPAPSPSELARAVLSLWSDPRRARELGASARAWVLREHTWSRAADRLHDRIKPWLDSGDVTSDRLHPSPAVGSAGLAA